MNEPKQASFIGPALRAGCLFSRVLFYLSETNHFELTLHIQTYLQLIVASYIFLYSFVPNLIEEDPRNSIAYKFKILQNFMHALTQSMW